MTAPIRSQSELRQAFRNRRDELNLSHETIDNLAGWQAGYCSKLLCEPPIKNFGDMSLASMLGALALQINLVEDLGQRAKVQGRWQKRKRPQKLVASLICVKREEMPDTSKQLGGFALMQILGKAGGIKSGKKRRAKAMRRRALQSKRSHAARMRWAKQSVPAPAL